MAILDEARSPGGDGSGLVFPSKRGKPVSAKTLPDADAVDPEPDVSAREFRRLVANGSFCACSFHLRLRPERAELSLQLRRRRGCVRQAEQEVGGHPQFLRGSSQGVYTH